MDAKKTLIGLTLTVIFVFALGATAMASDIAFYVGATPGGAYDQETMLTDVAKIISETGHLFNDVQQFADDNQEGLGQPEGLGQWADANMDDGELDIIWINGSTPSVLYPLLNEAPDGSRAEEWLDNGNMIINVGDWFSWGNFETGEKVRNTEIGAGNILDLDPGFITGADGTRMTVTDAGKMYMPSLGDEVGTDRPVNMDNVVAPWEIAEVFAAGGNLADPIVISNMETGGYFAVVNQGWGDNQFDRGTACAELIGNWLFTQVIDDTTSVEPADKLATTWGREKTGY